MRDFETMIFNQINRFDDAEHEALMGVWWSGVLLKQQSRRFFKGHAATELQFNAMMALKYADAPFSQQDLSERLLVDKSNLTGLVDSLEKLGFVKRCKVRGDRRFYHLKLTDDGLAFLDKVEKPYRKLVHKIMSVFTPDELRHLTESMVRLQQGMEEMK